MGLHSVLVFEDSKPIFSHDTPVHDDAPSYQVWVQKVERFRRYRADKILTHVETDTMIPIYPPSLRYGGRGGAAVKQLSPVRLRGRDCTLG